MTPAMSEFDRKELGKLDLLEPALLQSLCWLRRERLDILRRNGIRQAERIAPRVLQMRSRTEDRP